MIRQICALMFQSIALRVRYAERDLKVGLLSMCDHVTFGRFNTIYNFVRLRNVTLGDYTYIANGARVVNASIGKFCSIGPTCKIGLGLHPTGRFVSTHPAFYSTKGEAQVTFTEKNLFVDHQLITLGNDVWIGESAIVRDGVNIAHGAIVGAGAVVTHDVPAYAIVAGVPARVIRYRFKPEEIAALLESRWWDRDEEWLRHNAAAFADLDLFRGLASSK